MSSTAVSTAATAASAVSPPASPPAVETAAVPADSPLVGRSVASLTQWVTEHGQPAYRGKQLHQWIYQRGIRSLDEVTVFSKKVAG